MTLYETQLAVERFFETNWDGDIHFSDTEKRPKSTSWIYLDVVPVLSESSLSECYSVVYSIQITAYGRYKGDTSKTVDRLIRVFDKAKLGKDVVSGWSPIGQGPIYDELHYRKVAFGLTSWN